MRGGALAGYGAGAAAIAAAAVALAANTPARITIDYPLEGSIFPPDFSAPTFLWRDPQAAARRWAVEVSGSGFAPLRWESAGERWRIGEIDRRCVSNTNELPKLTAEQAAAHTWKPDPTSWERIKKRAAAAVNVTITGYDANSRAVSKGRVSIRTSLDPAGAPIFYRDVPLMPAETEKGVIKPLAANAVPLIAWRLRDIAEPSSRVVMEGIHSCANCHSFSHDGKTMGMDVDGPLNDKGLYAVVPVGPRMQIAKKNIVEWSTFRGKLGGKLRVGFMSQVSPDGQYVVTTINDSAVEQSDYQRRRNPLDLVTTYFVANFKDYRFLQVFYPTRGILAWYSRATGRLQPLPGADDPRYVHTSATWSPDGRYLVFSRADARDAYPAGAALAEFANDPRETRMRYDIYRIPFNGGRGGVPERVEGASENGMSNSFPKISPDGRWIVYVQARNGQLMRPDSRLFIVPAAGGQARAMRCNTKLMNSWHSFSPNGRWMVFSSKSRSPYTQMFLTHIDEDGNDSPAVLIENSTAANRAVNIPEFVNIARGGMLKIEAPVTEYFRVADAASELASQKKHEAAAAEWRKALELAPDDALVHFNLGNALNALGRTAEAVEEYERAVELSPEHSEAHNNLGKALAGMGKKDEAMAHFERAVEARPDNASAQTNLAASLAERGRMDEAIAHLQTAIRYEPDHLDARNNLGVFLAMSGRFEEAATQLEKAVRLSRGEEPLILDLLGRVYAESGQFAKAVDAAKRALAVAMRGKNAALVEALKASIVAYQAGRVPAR